MFEYGVLSLMNDAQRWVGAGDDVVVVIDVDANAVSLSPVMFSTTFLPFNSASLLRLQ